MEVGFGLLRLSPREFWTMTPRELAAAARALAPSGTGAVTRAEMVAMMAAMPDKRAKGDIHG